MLSADHFASLILKFLLANEAVAAARENMQQRLIKPIERLHRPEVIRFLG